MPRLDLGAGARLRIQIPARDVMLSLDRPSGTSALNVLPAVVREVLAQGGEGGSTVALRLDCGGAVLIARVTRRSAADLGLVPGRAVHAVVKSVALDATPADAASRLARYDGTV